jgi:hypothetical protein
MTLRKRGANPVISPAQSPELWPRDDILAPNSDTESEPLVKRRKHIDQIAQFCRDGGDLMLISTTLRGPVTQNPWRRQTPVETDRRNGGEAKEAGERLGKRKRKGKGTGVKDGKVDRYFVAQKNSQERDVMVKKVKKDVETFVVDKENAIVAETSQQQQKETEVEEQFKAVPRIIDFDVVPQSTDITSQNYPSLQLIMPVHEPAQPIPSTLDDSNTLRPENAMIHSDDGVALFDAPTPEKPTTSPKKTAPEPTAQELEVIRYLIGDEQSHPQTPIKEEVHEEGLYDDPTPQPISTKSPTTTTKYTPPDSFPRILPSSLTNRPSPHPSFSPVIKPGPLELSRLDEINSLQNSSHRRHKHPSPTNPSTHRKRRRSSSGTLMPSLPTRPPLQRSQSHQTPQQKTTPLNTQSMFDLANQSFNAIVQHPKQPMCSTPLLPSVTFTTKPPTPNPAPFFTPFRELNRSPVREEVSFKLGEEESPLTYSPLVGGRGVEELWGDVRGFIGTWSLEEEVEKYKAMAAGKEGEAVGSGESQSQSQGCLVGG